MAALDDEGLSSHMQELLNVISSHQWVYDIQMTKFFENCWWQQIPAEWADALLQLSNAELNQLPFGFTKENWPASLRDFILQCQQLSLSRAPPPHIAQRAVAIDNCVKVGVGPKKLHEVSHLAGVVRDVCVEHKCSLVLDIGSGLGYLGRCLSQQCGLSVVGIEREPDRVCAANKRSHEASCEPIAISCDSGETERGQRDPRTPKTTTNSCSMSHDSHVSSSLTHDSHVIHEWTSKMKQSLPSDFCTPQMVSVGLNVDQTPSTVHKLTSLLKLIQERHASPLRVCVVGLHCCGPLSPTILRLFSKGIHPSLQALLLLGCCYHKTEHAQYVPNTEHAQCDPTTEHAQWAPMSQALDGLIVAKQLEISKFDIEPFGLRLAAQETKERWCKQSSESHDNHMRRVAYRAMAEVVCPKEYLSRNAFRRLKVNSIEEYAMGVATNLHDDELKEKLILYHKENKHFTKFIEPFTALQVCLQGVLESLLLLDRVAFLREQGLSNASLTPVFDPSISPRNMMIQGLIRPSDQGAS